MRVSEPETYTASRRKESHCTQYIGLTLCILVEFRFSLTMALNSRLLLFGLCLVTLSGPAMGAAQKNVLFIVVDDLRPELKVYYDLDMADDGHTVIYENIKTPHMDKLAGESLLLQNAFTQMAVCCPSRSSYMTGRRPDSTLVYDKQTYWREAGGNYTTIPQFFKEDGYLTVGMGKIYHPGPTTGSDDPISWSDTYPYFHSENLGYYGQLSSSWQAVPARKERIKSLPDQNLAANAINVLGEIYNGPDPFFMAVGFQKPHLPFTFPEAYLNEAYLNEAYLNEAYLNEYPEDVGLAPNNFPPENFPSQAWSTYSELREYQDIFGLEATDGVIGAMGTLMPDTKAKELRRGYYAAVTYIDALIGSVVDELTTLGIAENTIVTLVGDYGWQLGDHSEW